MMDATTTPPILPDDPANVPETDSGERQVSLLDQIFNGIRAYQQSAAFIPSFVIAAAIGVCFMALWKPLYELWTSEDGYYSHGFLVPLISGFVVYKWWPRIKDIPVKAFWPAVIPLLACLYLTKVSTYLQVDGLLSLCLIGTLLSAVWVSAGGKWMLALSPSILYLSFALPLWNSFITDNTNKLQLLSTTMAFEMIQSIGFHPIQTDPTVIIMDSGYSLDVAVPCSGLKLLVALTALTTFILLVGRLRWWANLVMLGLILPLGLFINGLRIALIGIVGNEYGTDAALKFHDWSGWITLILCFFILSKIARLLGWQD